MAYDSVPLEAKGISDEKLKFAKRLCDAYETTKLDGKEIQFFGAKISISTSDEIILGDNLPVKLGNSPDRTEKVKYKLLKVSSISGIELDAAISWGERNTGYPYHLIVFINGKSVIECYIPKWIIKKANEHFALAIPNTFNRNEGNQEFKQLMQEYLESTENNTGTVLDEGKIKIGDFPEELDWESAFDNHIRMLLTASMLRAEIRGICNLGLKRNEKQELVSKVTHVIGNIEGFNRDAAADTQGAQDVIRNCQYFVSFEGKFASVKYAAWKNVTIERYKKFRLEDNVQFHAKVAQGALEKLGYKLDESPELINQFEAWSRSIGLSVLPLSQIKIYKIDGIVPLKVRTIGKREIAEKTPEKADFELWAPSKYASFFPTPKEMFKINISNNVVEASRQNIASGEVIIGSMSGYYNSIRSMVLEKGLKLDDIVYLKKLDEGKSYEMFLVDEEDGKDMPKSNSKKMQDIITKGLEDFIKFVTNKRFSFGNELRCDEILTNYIFSLKTKPFVILSGISGTGKTKIAQFFAEFMCPDEEVEEAEMNTEDGSVYKVPTYFIKYSRIVLKNSIAELIRTPITEKSNEINVRFDGQEGKCWFGYANSQNRAKQILFRGEIARYIKNNVKIDDYLRIYVDSEGEEETIVFEKINPEKKRVIQKSNRYAFIPVRPDWTDNRSLLGFYNPITESYQPTELLKLMIRAKEDMGNPYFVIFDEMNLAKVEYYFSDFLSCMESRRIDGNGEITSEKIILHDAEAELSYMDDDGKEYKIPNRIEIPLNIYFTGTVNVDETTYMFSPKVLDRANVIEFNEVDMESYKEIILEENKKTDVSEIQGASKDFINYFTDNGRYCSRLIEKSFSKGLESYYDKLMELNGILKEYHMHFGYRVIDEIMMYLSYGYEYYDILMEIDLDIQILQKVLPKLNGNRKQLEIPLTRLLRYCFNVKHDDKEKMLSAEEKRIAFGFDYDALMVNQYEREERLYLIEPTEEQISEGMEPLFPRSAKKLCRMISMLDRQGYASFIE